MTMNVKRVITTDDQNIQEFNALNADLRAEKMALQQTRAATEAARLALPAQVQAITGPAVAAAQAAVSLAQQRAGVLGSVANDAALAGRAAGDYRIGAEIVSWSGSAITARTGVLASEADVQGVQALAEQADTKADSASNALGNLTLNTLNTRAQADGPQLVDGSRWVWAAGGTVNGGTVVAAAGGGVWVREKPQYSVAEFGTVQAVLNAVPYGQTADLSKGQTGVPAGLVHTGESSIQGGGTDNPITADAGLPTTTDLLTIRPAADGNAREGAVYRDLALMADAGGRNALYVDLSGNRRMNRVTFDNLYLRSVNRYAMEIFNEVTQADAFFTSRILGGTFIGGLNMQGGGDSLTVQGGTFTGPNESIRARLITEVQTTGDTGDSSQLVIMGNNCTGDLGVRIERGPRVRIAYNNLECGAGPGSGDALIYLEGGAGDPIRDATVFANYIAAAPHAKYGVHVGIADGVVISNNTLAAPGNIPGSACIYVSADAKNTVIGPNCYEGTPVIDLGVGTMGIMKDVTSGMLAAAGRATVTARALPRFTKSSEGIVTLSGSVGGGAITADSILFTLPAGFRSNSAAVQTFSCLAVDGNGIRTVMLYVDADGNVVLGQTVTTTLIEVSLNGVTFYAPRV